MSAADRGTASADASGSAELHRRALVLDGHNDLPWRIRREGGLDLDGVELDRRLEDGHTDLPRLREGGVDAQFWAAYVPPEYTGPAATRLAREQIDLIHRLIARYPDDLALARTAAEVRARVGEGKIASLIGVEGGHAIDGSLEILREFFEAGARYLTLTHNASIPWAAAAGADPDPGLSDFGREVLREMERLGMLIDLSHVSDRTMHDAFDTVGVPLLFSHSSARALADHTRNVPDDVLRRIPANGGVVMVNFFPGFLTPGGAREVRRLFAEEERIRAENIDYEAMREALSAWMASREDERGSVATIADHIDHIAEVCGPAHVGLGSDFDGIPITPIGMDDVSCYPALTEELAARGYSDAELEGVLGGNALRVMEAVEAAAGR